MISAQSSWYVPAGNCARTRPGDDHRARRHDAAVLDGLRARDVDDRHARGQRDVRGEHRTRTDPHALGDDAPRAEERAVLDDHRSGLRRLQDAADAHASREVDVGTDLGARADGGPRVDHRARADPGADVDVARHEDDALGEERAVSGHTRRHDPNAERRVDALDRDLVEEAKATDLDRLDLPQAEVEEDRLLRPLVDDPAVVARLGDPELATVEQVDRLLDRLRLDLTALPQLLDPLLEAHQRTSSRIAAARAQSSSVGTSA